MKGITLICAAWFCLHTCTRGVLATADALPSPFCGTTGLGGNHDDDRRIFVRNCTSVCYQNSDEGNDGSYVCLPHFLIYASAKSGSSALHFYLEQHPAVRQTIKEIHMSPPLAIQQVFTFRQPVCSQIMGVMWEPPNWIIALAKPLIFVLLRRPDDLIYASYHFWCNKQFDLHCDTPGAWVDPSKHHRSPAHFHWLLTEFCQGDPCKDDCPLRCPKPVETITDLRRRCDISSVHLIFTEELMSSTATIMHRAFTALGLNPHLVNNNTYNVAVNVGSKKGAHQKADKGLALGASYPDMWPQTRSILQKVLHLESIITQLESMLGRNIPWQLVS